MASITSPISKLPLPLSDEKENLAFCVMDAMGKFEDYLARAPIASVCPIQLDYERGLGPETLATIEQDLQRLLDLKDFQNLERQLRYLGMVRQGLSSIGQRFLPTHYGEEISGAAKTLASHIASISEEGSRRLAQLNVFDSDRKDAAAPAPSPELIGQFGRAMQELRKFAREIGCTIAITDEMGITANAIAAHSEWIEKLTAESKFDAAKEQISYLQAVRDTYRQATRSFVNTAYWSTVEATIQAMTRQIILRQQKLAVPEVESIAKTIRELIAARESAPAAELFSYICKLRDQFADPNSFVRQRIDPIIAQLFDELYQFANP